MLLDSVVIRLIKSGVGIGPDYSLSVYGNGKVLYEGVEKVKVKGVVESFIDNDKVLSLLSEFKEKGFFSLNDSYGEEDTNIRPCTKISISFQKEDGETVTKRVKYCKGDVNAPKELIALENKIQEIVDTIKWVGGLSEYEDYEQKKEPEKIAESIEHAEKETLQKPTKKKPSKLLTIAATLAVIVIVILSIAICSGIFSQSSQEKNSSNEPNIIYLTPEITLLKPASHIRAFRDYDNETIFNKTQNISIYEEYTNISTINNETCDLTLELIVEDMNTSTIRHADNKHKTEIGNCSQGWYFLPSAEWPTGGYYARTTLRDNLSNTNATKTTFFVILDI